MPKHIFLPNQVYPSTVATNRGRFALTNEDVDGSGSVLSGITTGVADDYDLTLSFFGHQLPAAVLNAGLEIKVNFNVNNTGNAVIDVNGFGDNNIRRHDGSDLQIDDLVSGRQTKLKYSGSEWRLSHPSPYVVQSLVIQDGLVNTGATEIPRDASIPQITEGDEYMFLAITPTNINNTLVIESSAYFAHSAASAGITMALFRDATANALAAAWGGKEQSTDQITSIYIRHELLAGALAATTFRIRAGGGIPGTTTFNGTAAGSQKFGGVMASFLSIREEKR